MTLQTFVAWKKRKLREKAEAEKAAMDEKKKNMKSGLTIGMSGRDMFTFDPKMVSNGVSKSGFSRGAFEFFQRYQFPLVKSVLLIAVKAKC